MRSVAIIDCNSYEQELVDEKVARLCQAANMPDPRGKRILLKPNILSDAPVGKAITTNPAVIRAMIHLLRAKGAADLFIGDSPGLQGPSFSPRTCGIAELCSEEGVPWVDFTRKPKQRPIPHTGGKSLPLASIIDEVDMVISLPKFKTHQLMYATGALKNLFGLVPNLHKSPCHVLFPTRKSFASMIIGIQTTVKASFALMDGIIGMEGAGPANGKPRQVGYLLASSDLTALDYAQAVMMGYDPLTIPIVERAIHFGLGGVPSDYPLLSADDLVMQDFQRIEQQKYKNPFMALLLPSISTPLARIMTKLQRRPPRFLADSCIRCKRCIAICPANALSLQDGRIRIATKRCIRCYCCHEVCPANAIEIEDSHKGKGR